MTLNGQILSAGGDALNATQCGGGSGGTIFVSSYRLYGNATLNVTGGSASISTQGSGGAGSGGRIKILRYRWDDATLY